MPKIVRFHQTGRPEVLQIADEPLVQPKQGEVRLRAQALGLNRAEAMFRAGVYLGTAQLPSRLGYEAAGIVDAVGPGVSGVEVGERVSTIPAFGLARSRSPSRDEATRRRAPNMRLRARRKTGRSASRK